MITVTICLGSFCHQNGSMAIIDTFRRLILENKLDNRVELAGRFCTGNCAQAVCVTIGNDTFSVKPDNAEAFFRQTVIANLE